MSPVIKNLDNIIGQVPAMPIVAQQIMRMLNDPLTNNIMLAEALSRDQSMTSRVLHMANSPFFGLRSKVASISNAIFVLGHSTLNSLVMAACTRNLVTHPGLMEKKIWEHALGTAVAARLLAKRTGLQDSSEAFISGLLHDIGKTCLAVVYREEYKELFKQGYHDKLPLNEMLRLEKVEFGYDHSEIGALVLNKWNLPKIYTRVALLHHTELEKLLDCEEKPKVIALSALANMIALAVGLGRDGPDDNINVYANVYVDMLGVGAEIVSEILERTQSDYEQSREQFGVG